MKSYNELTRLGKLKRMRSLAIKALAEYDLSVQWIKFLADDTNIPFKVHSLGGDNYVLRIYSDEETTLAENQAEVFWLEALKKDTDLKFTEPVLRTDGEAITLASQEDIPGEKRCILFTWVPGRALEESLNPDNYFKLGVTLAKLHYHAESLRPLPDSIKPKKWDKPFYYPNEPVVYNTAEYKHLFNDQQIHIIDRAISIADKELDRLYAKKKDKSSFTVICITGMSTCIAECCTSWILKTSCWASRSRMSPSRCIMGGTVKITRICAKHFNKVIPAAGIGRLSGRVKLRLSRQPGV